MIGHNVYNSPSKRLTCEDLGKCNLKTGQVFSFTPKQVAIADLWNISENDIAQPVNLWGDK